MHRNWSEDQRVMEDRGQVRRPVKSRQPQWKEKLREICLQRVRHERRQLLWKIRCEGSSSPAIGANNNKEVVSAFGRIVADELNKVKQTSVNVEDPQKESGHDAVPQEQDADMMIWEYEPMTSQMPSELANEDYEELMLAMESALCDDLQAELQNQEAALLREYEAADTLEDQSLTALVERWQENEEGGVLCPLCRTRCLHQTQCIIFCTCGQFRLDTQDDQVGLDYLQRRLADVVQEHMESDCYGQLSFSLESRFDITALYMQCSKCPVFQWVL